MITRRKLLQVGALSAGMLAAPHIARAQRAEYSYKYANNLPLSHPMNVRAMEAAERLKQETDGRFELKVFPSNQLGSDTDMLSQVRSGGIEFFTMSGIILSTLVPVAAINCLGFLFPDYPTVWKAMDGDLGAYIRQAIMKANLMPMDKVWDNGFRHTTTSTIPINKPEDFKGMKIRIPVSPSFTSLFKALGAAPVGMNFAEVYSALQTKVIDAHENPLPVISTAKLYEVQKYLSLTTHSWDGYWYLANSRAWRALPDDLKEVVAKNINQAGLDMRNDVQSMTTHLAKDLEDKGMIVNSVDTKLFRDAIRQTDFYSYWKGQYGEEAWSLLEQYTGKLV
ncbi:TRAP transporter substrate-binding protein (plasmid) [Bartonella sp. HY329]|uniref:TRAP transporter substrate-binding protein n=1 Tax=unclassified Bartonella TaxID=2645622 RepID=UPI0021C66AB7|nr:MULTISPECIES: TRAP transporter substrate-binding protein [unclassified Bartonella]UXM96543.1 TRAP transporter substrate-binding protein [Bartonella sp. HY329]UXN10866.1 TRAP transporter substrate-binding protein [Bartonella sp. HY328]